MKNGFDVDVKNLVMLILLNSAHAGPPELSVKARFVESVVEFVASMFAKSCF